MLRCSWLLLACLAVLPACGQEAHVAPPPTWIPVSEVPWARVSQMQIDAAKQMGVPVAFENEWGMRFVFIPPGTFQMGSPPDEPGRGDDEEQHEVRIAVGFYLQTGYVVHLASEEEEQHVGFNRAEVQRVVDQLSTEDPVWDYRLPTEAEWEYARRLANPTLLYSESVAGSMDDGNGEWCSDRYGPYPSWAVVDPVGPAEGDRFVVRGLEQRPANRTSAPATPTSRELVRLVIPLGYGLGKYGSIPITFQLTHPKTGAKIAAKPGGYDLRVIRMNDRLAARTEGTDPVWDRVVKPASPVTLTMVPGKYYVYAERKDGDTLARGIEIKFHVWEQALEVTVPIPEADSKRYGSGATEKPQ